MSEDLHGYLQERSRLPGLGWPVGLAVSLGCHGLVLAAILFTPKAAPPAEAKVTWVSLPPPEGGAPGGSAPLESGHEGERQRRVEEVAPVAEPKAKPAPPTPSPNAFSSKASHPLKGTSLDPRSLGKAPVASKGKTPAANPEQGAAGQGGGGGLGKGVPGLKASAGVQGGTGQIGVDGDFPSKWYLSQVQQLITGNWNRIGSATGRVQIYFRIKRNGSIEGARIETPSPSAVLDQSALLAVRRSDPLPMLPDAFEGQTLNVWFSFTFLGN